jgi:two-component system, chemotaxis family, sensor kinase Cph1
MRHVIGRLERGHHAALFYRNRSEQFAAVIPYIEIGLARNERCLYIAGDNSVPMVIDAMQAAGIDVSSAQRRGQLTVATPEQTYLKHGVFEPEKMVEGLRDEIALSLTQGFSALRSTGELGWAVGLPSALLRLFEYETLLESKFASNFIALCQYNESLFQADVVTQMLRIHPMVVTRNRLMQNPFYLGPGRPWATYPRVDVDHLVSTATVVYA